ncbi:hypothetical protein GCM10010405_59250 [Streptomyces macrosporus]|uniref:Uncharacterized protein n=1 Tax=Streptomyces macrosporus TaxID=44032 RepID=A0ABP5XS54_9ACTN
MFPENTHPAVGAFTRGTVRARVGQADAGGANAQAGSGSWVTSSFPAMVTPPSIATARESA